MASLPRRIGIELLRIAAGGLSILSVHAAAKQPSDIELRAAYCIPVVKHMIGLIGDASGQPELNDQLNSVRKEFNDKLNRLQAYVIPKISSPDADPLPFVLAMKRGEHDFQKLSEFANGATTECSSRSGWDVIKACIDAMTMREENKELTNRLERCNQLDWLPF